MNLNVRVMVATKPVDFGKGAEGRAAVPRHVDHRFNPGQMAR
jgi:hypothetical protein